MNSSRQRGFSLVEVVIAIGIIAFAIVAIFGLMSAGLRNGQESASDLALGMMTQSVSANLRMAGYQAVLSNAAYLPSNTNANFYFNLDGDMALDGAGAPSTAPLSNSYYLCSVARRTITTLPTTNIVFLRLVFSWPLQAPVANQQKRVILTSLGNNG